MATFLWCWSACVTLPLNTTGLPASHVMVGKKGTKQCGPGTNAGAASPKQLSCTVLCFILEDVAFMGRNYLVVCILSITLPTTTNYDNLPVERPVFRVHEMLNFVNRTARQDIVKILLYYSWLRKAVQSYWVSSVASMGMFVFLFL